MRVIWFSHLPLPMISDTLGFGKSLSGGWMQGCADSVLKAEEVELVFCFQSAVEAEGRIGNLTYVSMPVAPVIRRHEVKKYRERDYKRFLYIIEKYKPDIIQVFGMESFFQRQIVSMSIRVGLKSHIAVWVQGITCQYAEHFLDGISSNERKKHSAWELFRGTDFEGIKKRLDMHSDAEIVVVKALKHVFVRTKWDSAWCKDINPDIKLHFCNETLRSVFYTNNTWDLAKVRRYSIFVSQGVLVGKGLTVLLEALPYIQKKYSQVVVYSTGIDVKVEPKGMWGRITEPSYNKILRNRIRALGICDNVNFVGNLTADEMKRQLLQTHIYVSPSTIENSPNSLAEAMILGVPCVASDVGGVSSLLTNKLEGELFEFGDVEALANCICDIFANDELANRYSINAMKKAKQTHSKKVNCDKLLSEYRNILETENKDDC